MRYLLLAAESVSYTHLDVYKRQLLCMLTFGIGSLVLRPYQEAARAAFYREISAL